ncbi:protein PHYTOCHROME KINASE SUBSTRATE 4-like [Primulina tabacum]|uniref:protein PHYTOCHROME KINASE SUBSTRATE 4-like n=1 Tax=Primulina tabacum TaxID=48773 RepID=UPI003F5AA6F7
MDIVKNSQHESGFSINDTELSIFDARMYFSGIDDPKEVGRQQQKEEKSHDLVTDDQRVPSPVSSVDGYCRNFPQRRSFNATPTASISEASWNSRTGLLMSNPTGVSLKNFPSNDRKRRTFAAKKWLLDRKGNCCIGKKAVQVKEVELEPEKTVLDSFKFKTGKNIDDEDNHLPSDLLKNHQQKRLSQENNLETTQEALKQRVSAKGRPFIEELRRFSFPIVSTSNRDNENHMPALKNFGRKSNTSPLEDPPRKSLEVFRTVLDLSSVLGPMNLVSGRAGLFDRGSPIVGVTNIDDDIGSDASSDLFEIDSLSAPTSCNSMYCRRDYSVEEHPTFSARRIAISAQGINVTRKVEFDMKSLDEPCSASECYPPAAPS